MSQNGTAQRECSGYENLKLKVSVMRRRGLRPVSRHDGSFVRGCDVDKPNIPSTCFRLNNDRDTYRRLGRLPCAILS